MGKLVAERLHGQRLLGSWVGDLHTQEGVEMVEHIPWVGKDYEAGIGGQRIAIVGWSHWCSEGHVETDAETVECIKNVIDGTWNIPFFTHIRNYFGFSDSGHGAFWPKVLFCNYLPACVGDESERYKDGGVQIPRAQERFLSLLRKHSPQKVVILTSRHGAFPGTDRDLQPLGPEFPKFQYKMYEGDGYQAPAFFLRHPQGATGSVMRQVIQEHICGSPLR